MSIAEGFSILMDINKLQSELIDKMFLELLQFKNIEEIEYLSDMQNIAKLAERIGE